MTAPSVLLPWPDGTLDRFVPGGRAIPAEPGPPPVTRRALAAAHVVADPLADADPVAGARLDWDATSLPALAVVARARRRRGDGHAQRAPGSAGPWRGS